MSFNKKHPECGLDEVFVTNSDDKNFLSIGWRTKRKGMVAYDEDGVVLHKSDFPVFVKKKEIRNKDPKILRRLEA